MSWWPFRRRLEPLKEQTLEHDQKIIALDRTLAAEQSATRESLRRLDRYIVYMGAAFIESVRSIEREIDQGR